MDDTGVDSSDVLGLDVHIKKEDSTAPMPSPSPPSRDNAWMPSSDRKPPASSWLLPDDDNDEADGIEKNAVDIVERDQKRSGSSRAESPAASESPVSPVRRRKTPRAPNGPTQTATHLPRAENEARRSFGELKNNVYQNNKIGRSRGYKDEAMECECRRSRDDDEDNDELLCGEDSECINRLTQVECKGSDCSCGPQCANQRFQRRQYADVEIVQTEKKGFGLRAGNAIATDQFVYEYIGEVVEQEEFMKRMKQYRDEHIRHFYFMMLQREEFLDATRKGGIARFINHSCNPNCYVSKWHVGKHMRMGIFAKRDIIAGEELTFNYNVDRYGNDAQPCYCGEPNCVGSIGGKTQTDIGGMDQLFIDALGISDEVDRLDARGTRKKKSMLLDEDFKPDLRPLDASDDVAKVMTAVRQAASNRSILQKLLSRVHMTQETKVQRSLVRLHGFILMSSILDEWKDDKEIVLLSLGSLARWPLLSRNKVVDSGVDKQVQEFADASDKDIKPLAQDLLSAWDALEMSYRIARKDARSGGGYILPLEHRRADEAEDELKYPSLAQARAPNTVSTRLQHVVPRPLGKVQAQASHISNGTAGRDREDVAKGHPRLDPRRWMPPPANTTIVKPIVQPSLTIDEIIKRANEAEAEKRRRAEESAAEAHAAALAKEEEANRKRDIMVSISSKKRNGHSHGSSSSAASLDKRRRTEQKSSQGSLEDAARRLKKLVGEVVVRCMSSKKADFDREVFKKHAKDLTTIICEKEKKNPKMWPPRSVHSKYLPEGLSRDKREKITAFANDYITKLVAHRRAKKSQGDAHDRNGTTNGLLHSLDTPASGSQASGTPQDINRNGDDDAEDDDADSNLLEDDDDDDDMASHRDSRDPNESTEHSLTSVSPSTSSALAGASSTLLAPSGTDGLMPQAEALAES